MHNIESIYYFIFIFSLLVIAKNKIKFISALLSENPKPLGIGNGELIILGLSISYIFTYLKFL
jgi:hypothetical protein